MVMRQYHSGLSITARATGKLLGLGLGLDLGLDLDLDLSLDPSPTLNPVPSLSDINVGDDIRFLLGIEIIYFDFDKSNIRYDAELELQKVLAVLNKYPEISIDIRSHTDSKGPASYNMALSERRAQSTRSYLIANGIAPDRLTARGMGESELTNSCGDGVACSELEHEQNRRSEFIITQMK